MTRSSERTKIAYFPGFFLLLSKIGLLERKVKGGTDRRTKSKEMSLMPYLSNKMNFASRMVRTEK